MSNPYDPYGQQPSNPYGGGGGGGGGSSFNAPGAGGFEQKKTDGVSIAALVTGLLCCAPVSLILGIVGIKRTKGGQRKGRGLAITGLVLGVLGLLVWVGVGIAGVAGFNFLDSIVTPADAKVGQCVNIDDEDDGVLLREAECNEEHDGEIVGVTEVTDENREQISTLMDLYCSEAIADEDEAKLTDYLGDIKAVTEDPEDIEVGDTLVCYVEPDDKLDEPIL